MLCGMAQMTGLSEKTEQVVQKMFPPEQQQEVRELLIKDCGNNLPFLQNYSAEQLERFRFAALKLSWGKLDGLYEAIILAQTDWRDALVAAGFGNVVTEHSTWADSYLAQAYASLLEPAEQERIHSEAQASIARLTRIWKPENEAACKWNITDGLTGTMKLAERTRVGFSKNAIMLTEDGQKGFLIGYFHCTKNTGHIDASPEIMQESPSLFLQFSNKWRDIFRRNCWLSGCAIEASATEKAEWVQEFSREEIEAWNLQF